MSRYRWIRVVGVLLVLLVGCIQSQKSIVEQNKALVISFSEASNAGNFDAMLEMLAPEFIHYCPERPEVTVEKDIALGIPSGEASHAMNSDATRQKLVPEFYRKWRATDYVVVQTREQFIEYLKANARVFPDSRQTLRNVVAEGDMVAFSLRYEGTQEGQLGQFAASHKRMQIDVLGIFRVRDGKLAELWMAWDSLAALGQLGHFPLPSASK
jgi:predicted ester cyclase